QAADGKSGAGERLPVHHLLGHAELDPDRAHLVFEQIAQRLDQLKPQAGRQAADVVVGLDLHRGGRDVGRGRLDDVRVQRSLGEKVDATKTCGLGLEDCYELAADDPPLLLRVDDAFERGQETIRGVDVADVHVEVA